MIVMGRKGQYAKVHSKLFRFPENHPPWPRHFPRISPRAARSHACLRAFSNNPALSRQEPAVAVASAFADSILQASSLFDELHSAPLASAVTSPTSTKT